MGLADEKQTIIDINIPLSKKQSFRINGDDTMIIELDTSDLSIIHRYEDGYKKLFAKIEEIAKLSENDDIEKITETLKLIDTEMRECVDYIFDSKVSDVIVKSGTMYDMYGSGYKFEHVLDALLNLYADNIKEESAKVKARIKKHTNKYISKRIATKPKRK